MYIYIYRNTNQYTHIASELSLRGLFSYSALMEHHAHSTSDTTGLQQWSLLTKRTIRNR
jgi:hypothetical protein